MSYTLSIVNGDLDFDLYGRSRTVNGTNKAAQDLGEMLQSRFDRRRNYGTLLEVGTVGYIDQSTWIKAELQSTVTRFQSVQRNAGITDVNELVTGVKSIDVVTDSYGAYTWNLQVYVGNGRLVSSYNGVIGRRRTALLGSSSLNLSSSAGTTNTSLSGDETVEQAQRRITQEADWGDALPGFVWKSPELPVGAASITAAVTPADTFAPTSVTVVPTVPATPKPIYQLSYVIDGVEVAVTTTAPYQVTIPGIKAGITTITIIAKAVDTSVVGGGTAQVTLLDYPVDRVWSGGKGAVDNTAMKFNTAWPFKGGNGIGTYPTGGKGAINQVDYQFRDGTYAEV